MLFYVIFAVNLTKSQEQTAVLSLDLCLEDGMKTLLLLHLLIQLLDLKTPHVLGFYGHEELGKYAASWYTIGYK